MAQSIEYEVNSWNEWICKWDLEKTVGNGKNKEQNLRESLRANIYAINTYFNSNIKKSSENIKKNWNKHRVRWTKHKDSNCSHERNAGNERAIRNQSYNLKIGKNQSYWLTQLRIKILIKTIKKYTKTKMLTNKFNDNSEDRGKGKGWKGGILDLLYFVSNNIVF